MIRRPCHAAHEAGHAVIAEYLGKRVKRVLLTDPTESTPWWGLTEFACSPFRSNAIASLIYMAGPAADCLAGYAPASARRKTPDAWLGDWKLTEKYCTAADRVYFIGAASQLLRGPCRVAWHRVSKALVDQDLTGAQVRAAFHGPIPDLD